MRCVIFGAGKIARGFIGHLLYLSNIPFTFVEKADALADLINERGQYTVNVLGHKENNCVVTGARALKFDQKEEIAQAIAEADAVFDAVGGKNLPEIVPFLTAGIEAKAKVGGKLNFVTCENWKKPADVLREGIEAMISAEARPYFDENVGITEAVIMRSAIESDAELLKVDPLIVNVQNFWELPVDASRLKGELPPIKGLKLIHEFTGFLERKFYTYNAANGTTSFLGALLGFAVAYPIERRYIKFDVKGVWWVQVLKTVIGLSLIIAVKELLKIPLVPLIGTNLCALVRYFLLVAIAVAGWPLTFPYFNKLSKK